jgi:hypothetical protein
VHSLLARMARRVGVMVSRGCGGHVGNVETDADAGTCRVAVVGGESPGPLGRAMVPTGWRRWSTGSNAAVEAVWWCDDAVA